jgi:hypothetical protein
MEQDNSGVSAYEDLDEEELEFGSMDESMIVINQKAINLDRK